MRGSQLTACAVLVLCSITGGTKVMTQQNACYQPGDAPITHAVSETATYQVKVLDDGKYRGVHGTETLVFPGETLGFFTASDGAVQAITPRGNVRLQIPPDRRLIWYSRSVRQTQFGREVDKAIAAAGATAVVAGEIALAGAALYLEAKYGDDDCDPPQKDRHK
jgi:hypothetical protein